MLFYTLPLKLLGKDPGTVPEADTWALENIQWNIDKHREPREELLSDYMGHLLGYMSSKEAASSGVHIVCLRTLQRWPWHSLLLSLYEYVVTIIVFP